MRRFQSLLRAACLVASLLMLLGCQKIFGDFTIDDSAFVADIRFAPTKDLYTTEWGGQAKFTMVLAKAPTHNVTVALASSNSLEGKASPASVTFTKDDWNAPQVITVTGQDDFEPDRTKAYKIITEPVVSDDPHYSGKNPIDIELVNVDNETAGITVTPRSGLVTNEAGGQDTFTVVLNSPIEQGKEVRISLASSNTNEGRVSPESLVFTPVNWMAPQLVTITGVDDELKDQKQDYKVTVASASEDKNYASLMPISVEVTNQDNESAGLTVAFMSGIDPNDSTKLRTSEGGDPASFTVVLNAPPSAEVLIPVSSSVSSEGVASPELLTFTPLNWNAPQTVTVMGVDDPNDADGQPQQIADGDQPYQIVLGIPQGDDPDYTALTEALNVPVSNVDNDKAGFTLMLLSGIDPQDPSRLITSETGTTATFSVALNSQPSDTVSIDITSGMPHEGMVNPIALRFTVDNWKAPQIVSVMGVDDPAADGSPLYFVKLGVPVSADLGYQQLNPPDVQVTNQDDDSAGVRIVLERNIDPSNPNRLVTDEYGTTATFTVALTSEPEHDVSIRLSSNTPKQGMVTPAVLTFTKLTYRAPQEVTVTGLDDDQIVDGNQPFAINVEAAQSEDANFNGKFASQVPVTNRDNDSAGVIVTPTAGLTTGEGSTTATASFTIRLQSMPRDNVSIAISSSDPAEGRPNVTSVTFTQANWNANQTVIVTGQEDDGVQDGNRSYRIILAPAQSSGDPNYNGKPDPPDVTLTNIDNDSAGIVVSPTSGLTTSEDGTTATFTIAVTSKPVGPNGQDADVTIRLTSSRQDEGSVNPAIVKFTGVNWRSPQTVTVTGVNEDVVDGPQTYLILTSAAQSTDANYNNRQPSDVSVKNTDNDSEGVRITPLPSPTPRETTEKSAGKATFGVALNSQPTHEVTFTVGSLDPSEAKVSPATLKFTTSNWKTEQIVTVTGVDDDEADGDQQYGVRLSNASSTDLGYNGKFGTDLPFVNIDDDQAGFDIVAPAILKTTEENEGSTTFTVSLRSQPMGPVSIALSSSDEDEGTVSPAMLSFTTGNWATAQTVTVKGVQDEVADGTRTYQVRLANASSPNDAYYDGKFGTQLEAQNADDDEPGFIVVSDPAAKTTEKGGKTTFTVVLKSKPAGTANVTVGLNSNNKNEGTVSPNSMLFTGDDWNQPRTATVTGVDDKKVDGDISYQIVFTTISADSDYKVPPQPLALSNTDDDEVGVLVTPTSCSTTPGTSATFTIQLNSQPSSNVTISLTSDTVTQGTVSPESVTFSSLSPGGWDMPQTVTVTGVNDGSMGMMTAYKIITGDASAPGETTGYNGYSVADVSCTNTTP